MNKLVIHIGSPKTGTSSIQSFLSENEGILNEQGWSYPDTYSKWNAIIGETSSYTVERRKQVNGQLLYEVFGTMDKELSDKYVNMLKSMVREYNTILDYKCGFGYGLLGITTIRY